MLVFGKWVVVFWQALQAIEKQINLVFCGCKQILGSF